MSDISRDRGHTDQSVQDSVRRHGLRRGGGWLGWRLWSASPISLSDTRGRCRGRDRRIAGLRGRDGVARHGRQARRQAERDWFMNHPAR